MIRTNLSRKQAQGVRSDKANCLDTCADGGSEGMKFFQFLHVALQSDVMGSALCAYEVRIQARMQRHILEEYIW